MVTLIEREISHTRRVQASRDNIVVLEWDIQEHPSLYVHLSYYRHPTQHPLPCLSIEHKHSETSGKYLDGSKIYKDWDDTIPSEAVIQELVEKALRG